MFLIAEDGSMSVWQDTIDSGEDFIRHEAPSRVDFK
jgi:hypothetical protein